MIASRLPDGGRIDRTRPMVFTCAQTLIARAGVLLHQLTDEPRYRIHVRPSFAPYLAAWLTDASAGATPIRRRQYTHVGDP